MSVTDADRRYALAVDLGTGGPKVGFATLGGRLASFEHHRVETRRGADGAAEQDAEEWWRLICESARRQLAAGACRAQDVAAVVVTGQWASRVAVDERGTPVAPCVMWSDTRGRRHSRALMSGPVAGYDPVKAARWIRRSGGLPSPDGADAISHILHIERDRPGVAAAARWLLEPVDHLTMRFSGRATATPASMLAAWLTDNRRLDRPPAYDPELVAMAGIDARRLPPLLATGSVVGPVTREVAAELGLPREAQVVTGIPDLHAATIGSGAVRPYEAHLSVSTTGWISCPLPRKRTDALHSMATVPGLGDGRYVLANSLDSAGICLEWARASVFDGAASYEELMALAATAPAGSGGVVFSPWLAGTRSPVDDRTARGGWQGVSLRTTRAELVRAVLEGVASSGRWLHDAVERLARRRLDPVRVIGGGAQADLWCEIHAGALDRTVERVRDPATAVLRGAALFGGLALGALTAEQAGAAVEVDAVFRPDPAVRGTYAALRAELPRRYRAQKGMARRLGAVS